MSKLFKVSDDMPSWLRQACEFVGKKKEVVAEATRLENLPTVEWKDETFHVKFNANGATLYNKYKNEVRNIDRATTVEEVQAILDKDVVAGLEEENVVTANEEVTAIEDEPMIIEDDNEFNNELIKLAEEETIDKVDVEKQVIADDITEEITEGDVPKSIDNVQEEYVSLKDYNHVVARVNQLERELKKMVKVAKKLNKLEVAFAEAQHAYNPEIVNVDNGAQDLEVQHYQEMANATQEEIEAEHNCDLSNMQERAKHFLNKNINTGNDIKEDINKPVEENINEDAVEILKDEEEHCDGNCSCGDDCCCNHEECECNNGECCCNEICDEEAMNNFNNQICPCCQHAGALQESAKMGSIIGFECKNCNAEIAYDLNTQRLFVNGNK